MATKEKWIDLFEKAVGHPPHVLEIEEGQKSDFDLRDFATKKTVIYILLSDDKLTYHKLR